MDSSHAVSLARAKDFESRLDALLAGVEQLPTLPQILLEVRSQLHDSKNSAADLASAIQDDPALTANILRLANSAFYGFSERFVDVTNAVVAIGRSEIERMVYATVLIDSFGIQNARGSMDYAGFWTHCLQAAEVADFLSTHHIIGGPQTVKEGYLGGLLHDIGKLILNQYFHDDWIKVQVCAKERACRDADAERMTIGMDHGEIGARLLKEWALPPDIVEATRWHHQPTKCDPKHALFAQLVSSANSLCHAHERGALGQRGVVHPLFAMEQRHLDLLARTLNNATERATLLLS